MFEYTGQHIVLFTVDDARLVWVPLVVAQSQQGHVKFRPVLYQGMDECPHYVPVAFGSSYFDPDTAWVRGL